MKEVYLVQFIGHINDYEHRFPDKVILGIFDSEEKANKYAEKMRLESEDEDCQHYDKFEYLVDAYVVE